MNVLCWNVSEVIFEHWTKVVPESCSLTKSASFSETIELLSTDAFEYCFVYLDDASFSEKVEQVVLLRARYPHIKLLAFPYLRSQSAALRMLSMGLNGQCSPYIAKEQLKLVLSVVDSGEIWGGKEFIQQLIQQSANAPMMVGDSVIFSGSERLTDRELDVADLVAKGMSNKEIARSLDVTERTVKAHLTTIFKKLSIKDRLSLALHIQRGHSLVESETLI